jgi:hypothetical protein
LPQSGRDGTPRLAKSEARYGLSIESGEEDLGVIFMTLYAGKAAGVYLAPPGTAFPEEYSALASR